MAEGRYSVGGRGGPTAASVHFVGALWNPHATKSIFLVIASSSKTVGTQALNMHRISARGTPGSTVTPDIDNDLDGLLAPISGAVLDLAPYSVQPTRVDPAVGSFMPSQSNPGATEESWFGEEGLRIPAGTGVGWIIPVGVATTSDLSCAWDE